MLKTIYMDTDFFVRWIEQSHPEGKLEEEAL